MNLEADKTLILVSIKKETRKEGQKKKDQIHNWLYQCELRGRQNPKLNYSMAEERKGKERKAKKKAPGMQGIFVSTYYYI